MRRALAPIDPSYFDKAKMSAFELIGCRVDEIPRKADLVPQISRAKISRCHLTCLPKGLDNYHYIKILDLSENELTTVEEVEVSGLIILQYVDLSLNRLQTLTPALPSTISHLDISFNPGISVESIWALKLPKLETLRITHCNLSTLPTSKPVWVDSLRTLALDGNNFTRIPKAVEIFPNLDEITFFGNDFKQFSSLNVNHPLKVLNYVHNQISSVESNLSLKCQTLYLNYCPLTKIYQNILNIAGLRVLMLSNTSITGEVDIILPPQLAIIDLSFNHINRLSTRFVQSTGSISVINLTHNDLEVIPDEFPNPISFSQILLSHNKLSEIPKSMLCSKSCERFFVAHNNLTTIPEFRFPQLRELDVSFNQLTEISDSFAICSFLIIANFSFNQLTDLPKSLATCRRLSDLYASRNQFTALPKCIFGFASLKFLILSSNLLTTLPSPVSSFFFLKTLDLSNNRFVSIPKQIESLHSLKVLSLSHNLIESIDPEFKFPPMLSTLDLSYNLIPELSISGSFPGLLALSMACNKLTVRNLNAFPAVHFYSDFGNQIKEDTTDYSKLKNLRVFEDFGNLIGTPVAGKHSMYARFPANLSVGYASFLGPRPTMEDTVCFECLKDNDLMVALFDGHAGFEAADHSSQIVRQEYERIVHSGITDPEDVAIMFSGVFGNIQALLSTIGSEGGCTAALAMVVRNTVYAGGLGDSRVIRVKKNGAVRITHDSKPMNVDEFRRLKSVGLGVTVDGRIKRKLAVARALGDFWCGDGLFVIPDIVHFPIDEDDVGIVVACDGLWDVMEDEEVGMVVREAKNAEDAAMLLKNTALALGTTDNISVAVVLFRRGGFDPANYIERIPILQINEADQEEPVFIPPPSGRRRR